MRIGINTVPLYGRTPGLRTYTAGLLRALHASDADMEWRVLLRPADAERLGLSGDPRFRLLPLAALANLSHVPVMRFVWRNASDQALVPLWAARCDLMHYLDSYGPLVSPRAAPFVLTVHDLLPLRSEAYYARWAQTYLAGLMRATIPRARALLAVSEATARDLMARCAIPRERVVVVPNGTDTRFRPYSASERQRVIEAYRLPAPYVLFAGSINPRKNVTRLIRAFARVRREHSLPHQLLLVGSFGWQYEDVVEAMQQANMAGGGEVVRHLGQVADDEIAPLIAGADCLAYPSLEEGFGLPALEAIACGTPVLHAAIPALNEVTNGAGLAVDPLSETAIADGLLTLLRDPALRATLRQRGLIRAQDFAWSSVARAVIRAYRQASGIHLR